MKILKLIIVILSIFIFKIIIDKEIINIFSIKKEEYILKIIENKDYKQRGIEENLFYYIRQKNKIGCGELLSLGIDFEKEYLYGKLKYKEPYRGVGVYNIGHSIIGRDVFLYSSPYSGFAAKKISEICNGYFILELKTGNYRSNLSEKEYQIELQSKGIERKEKEFLDFMKKYGGKALNFNNVEYWMSTREP